MKEKRTAASCVHWWSWRKGAEHIVACLKILSYVQQYPFGLKATVKRTTKWNCWWIRQDSAWLSYTCTASWIQFLIYSGFVSLPSPFARTCDLWSSKLPFLFDQFQSLCWQGQRPMAVNASGQPGNCCPSYRCGKPFEWDVFIWKCSCFSKRTDRFRSTPTDLTVPESSLDAAAQWKSQSSANSDDWTFNETAVV